MKIADGYAVLSLMDSEWESQSETSYVFWAELIVINRFYFWLLTLILFIKHDADVYTPVRPEIASVNISFQNIDNDWWI